MAEQKQPTVQDIIAAKDQIIGQLYQKVLALESILGQLQAQAQAAQAAKKEPK